MSEHKRVSWVELYFDLVFVLAVAQVAHAVADHPSWTGVWTALALFFGLWWTWIGFSVLYNRHGSEGSLRIRLLILGATVPCGIAAAEVHNAASGHIAGFALSLAAARLFLAVAHAWAGPPQRPVMVSYVVSAAGFAASAALASPWCYVVWVVMILQESTWLLWQPRPKGGTKPKDMHEAMQQRRAIQELTAAGDYSVFKPEADVALEPHHLAERFGLFVIILLGELVITAGQGALEGAAHGSRVWIPLAGGIVLAGAAWWLYFDSSADVNLRVLEQSGGSPMMARAVYAFGHMLPAFGLILIAAGLRLLLSGSAPHAAYWFVAAGLATYLAGGTRGSAIRARNNASPNAQRMALLVQAAVLTATVQIGWLAGRLPVAAFVWLVAAWAAACAVAATYAARMAR